MELGMVCHPSNRLSDNGTDGQKRETEDKLLQNPHRQHHLNNLECLGNLYVFCYLFLLLEKLRHRAHAHSIDTDGNRKYIHFCYLENEKSILLLRLGNGAWHGHTWRLYARPSSNKQTSILCLRICVDYDHSRSLSEL